ncbi:hypothetical protein BDV19DRAFT_353347 [Aspergillus venezuelensis]
MDHYRDLTWYSSGCRVSTVEELGMCAESLIGLLKYDAHDGCNHSLFMGLGLSLVLTMASAVGKQRPGYHGDSR